MNYLILLIAIFGRPAPYFVPVKTVVTDTLKTDTVRIKDSIITEEKVPSVCYDVVFANQTKARSFSFAPSLERLPRATDFSALADTSTIEYSYSGCVELRSALSVNLGSEYYYQTTVLSNQIATQQTNVISSGFLMNLTPLKIDSSHLMDYSLTVRSPVTDGQSYQTSSINQRTRIPLETWTSLGDVRVESWQRRFAWLSFLMSKQYRVVRILVRVKKDSL